MLGLKQKKELTIDPITVTVITKNIKISSCKPKIKKTNFDFYLKTIKKLKSKSTTFWSLNTKY